MRMNLNSFLSARSAILNNQRTIIYPLKLVYARIKNVIDAGIMMRRLEVSRNTRVYAKDVFLIFSKTAKLED